MPGLRLRRAAAQDRHQRILHGARHACSHTAPVLRRNPNSVKNPNGRNLTSISTANSASFMAHVTLAATVPAVVRGQLYVGGRGRKLHDMEGHACHGLSSTC